MNENCRTITIPTPIGAQMKPVQIPAHSPRSLIRAQQEAYVLSVLDSCEYSFSACAIANIIGEKIYRGKRENFPDYYLSNGNPSPTTRTVSQILRRLEAKGKVISTLYCGRRLYCIVKEGK